MPARTRVLINWLCYPPIGHALEAFKHAQGYLDLDPELDVHLLLPATAATSLAPRGITVHPVNLKQPEPDIRRLPADWDYMITDARLMNLREEETHLREARLTVERHVHVLKASGIAPSFAEETGDRPMPVLPYRRNSPLRLSAPPLELGRSRAPWSGLNVCILPAGSTPLQSPDLSTWRTICQTIQSHHPDVTFHFTGRSATSLTRARFERIALRRPAAWTTSTAVNRRDITALADELDRARVWWDCGFSQQLALISTCDLLIAPHTGFAFLAGALGTPWLTLSCCRWPEYFFNPTPFYSVFPGCPSYPSLGDDTECTRGHASDGCLTDLEERADEILSAAELLMDPATTYEQCVARHLACIDAHPRSERFYFFDGRDSLLGQHDRTTAPA